MQGGGRWETVTHHYMLERKYNKATWWMTNYIFVVSFFFIIFFFNFVVSTMKLHALAGRSKKKQKNKKQKTTTAVKWWSQLRKSNSSSHTRRRTRVTAFIFLVPLPQVHEPTPTSSPPAVHSCTEGSTLTTDACLQVSTLTHRFIHSALSLLSFLIGQTRWRHLMTSHICTKWLVFVYLSNYQGVLLWEKC